MILKQRQEPTKFRKDKTNANNITSNTIKLKYVLLCFLLYAYMHTNCNHLTVILERNIRCRLKCSEPKY